MSDLYNKILGGLLGGAAGDAFGAATEGRSKNCILECFGGRVTDFAKPPDDTFGAGNEPGGLTDDFSSAYFVAEAIVKNAGVANEEAVKAALIEWSEHHEFFDRFAGPTTRLAIKRFKGEDVPVSSSIKNKARAATNGSAMRISPLGLLNAGNLEEAIKDATLVACITHDNTLAISGACAVAAAVARACDRDADIIDIVNAGLYGARRGEEIGHNRGVDVAGPSVVRRIEIAADIATSPLTQDEKIIEIADVVGTGLHISSAVPAAFGFFVACKGDPISTIIETINIGYDTDTVGTIAGGIAGAYAGSNSFPDHILPTIERVNGLQVEWLAGEIEKIVVSKRDKERG